MHEYGLARLHLRAQHQRPVRRGRRDPQRCALSERRPVRQRVHAARAAGDAFGIGAGLAQEGRDVDAVADRDACDALAERLDDARAVTARRVRQLRQPRVLPRADVGLHGIHAGRVQANDHLARPWDWVVDVGHLQHLGPAELLDSDRSHEGSIEQGALRCSQVL